MTANISPLAGKIAGPSMLANIPRLVTAYFAEKPDPAVPAQRVAFGTSGHRGSALNHAFNEAHILAVSQAVCDHRKAKGITGPLFAGIDTHALAEPALASALEVFAANGVEVMIDAQGGYTPTPVISHAILTANKGRERGFADGVVITPSHNPPEDGGFKYNPPNGGPADTDITAGIERAANRYLEDDLRGVSRIPYDRARKAACVHRYDYVTPYVADLAGVVDMEAIRAAGVKIGIDPLGGAAVGYWQPIIERYRLAADVVSDTVDPTFRFMTVDWDGKIRMDCSSPYAMARLIGVTRKIRRRLCQRHRRRPPRHRHPLRRADESEPLPRRRDRLSVRAPPAVAQRQRGRQDHRLQRDHRPRREQARPKAGGNPGRFQMVRRRPDRRRVRLRRRGERRRLVPAAGRIGVDHRQGRHHFGTLGGRDDRAHQIRSEPSCSID